MSIVVMVDGAANMSKKMLKKYGLVMLPYNLIFKNGDTYKDDNSHKSLSELIEKNHEVPVVDQIGKSDISSWFHKYIDKGDDILFISVSSLISNAYNEVKEVADEFGSMIEVIDSENVGSGEAILALFAKEYIDRGYGLKQTSKYLNNIKRDIRSCYAIGDTSYLYNQNKCKDILNKQYDFTYGIPLIEINEGKLVLTYNAKDAKLVLQMLKNIILDSSRKLNLNYFIITYSGDKKYALKLKTFASKLLKDVNIDIVENNSTIFVNSGYNTVSLAFLIDND